LAIKRRDKLLTFQRRGTAQDASGQEVETWTDVTPQSWARILPVSGREYFNASGERAEVTHRIEINYRALAPRDRAVYGSRVFDIKSVINVEERNRDLLLMCTEHVV
jgi:SPP1 family predicted phage head-tail adaptor